MSTTETSDVVPALAAARLAVVERIEATATSRWPHPVCGYPRRAAYELDEQIAAAARHRLDRGQVPAVPWNADKRDIAGIEYVPWVRNTRMYPTGVIGDTPCAIIVAAESICVEIREVYRDLELPLSGQLDLDAELHEIAWAVAHILDLSTEDESHGPIANEERRAAAAEVREALIDHVAALELQRTELQRRLDDRREVEAQCQQEAREQQRRVEVLDPPDLSKTFGAAWLHQQAAARISQHNPDDVAVPTPPEGNSEAPRNSVMSFLSRHYLAFGYVGVACGVALIILVAVGYATAPRFEDQPSVPTGPAPEVIPPGAAPSGPAPEVTSPGAAYYGPPPGVVLPGVKVVRPGEQSYLPDGTPWTVRTFEPGCYWNEAATPDTPTGHYGWQACRSTR
ncbi:hypothetical protein [Mycolicibacterium nivoides]|uniref:Uncharacterized protein n=1 Tax=Mycolicibacterium nivoides TaxID=2487344 RepID=A0ABW9LLG7_9MYCO